MNSNLARIASALGLVAVRSNPSAERVEFTPPAPFSIPFHARAASTSSPLSLDAVYRAIFILQTSARQLSIDVWKGDDLLDTSRRPSFLNRPSLDHISFGSFIAETVSSLAQRGNAYWHVIRHGYEIIDVKLLNPLRVAAWYDNDRPRYAFDGKGIPASDIVHLRLLRQPGEINGLSPLQACAGKIDGALSTAHYGNTWTTTGGTPPGLLTTDQDLSREQAERYKKDANELLQYANGIAVLGKGLTYQKLYFTPSELQFIETQRDNVTAIARMFGIPAKALLASVEGSSDTYSNAEQENQQFYRHTLMAYLREIEEAFTYLAPNGQTVRFNVDGLLRSDTKTRYEAHKIGIEAGFLTIDEVREIEGLPTTQKEVLA